jgi:hypothetical protein
VASSVGWAGARAAVLGCTCASSGAAIAAATAISATTDASAIVRRRRFACLRARRRRFRETASGVFSESSGKMAAQSCWPQLAGS